MRNAYEAVKSSDCNYRTRFSTAYGLDTTCEEGVRHRWNMAGVESLYFAAIFSVTFVMEPNQIKSEITALRARFDALRGYL
jgi:hypothetical protein